MARLFTLVATLTLLLLVEAARNKGKIGKLIKKCRLDGYNFWGADIRNFITTGLEDCAKICRDEDGCQSITFRTSENRCWLKRKKGGENGPSPADDLISLNMECDRTPVDDRCKRDNTNYWGADLTNFFSAGFDDCAEKCRDTQDCQAFTLRKSDNYCWLKSKRGGQKGSTPNDSVVSMNIDCKPAKGFDSSDRSCAMENWNFWGADLRDFDCSGYEWCRTACFDTADCKSFTLRISDNHCWLKSKFGGWIGPDPANGLISDNMECYTGRINTNCKQENTNFWGADLRDFTTGSEGFSECAKACRMSQDCQSITFRTADNHCWLKNKEGGANGPSHLAGHNSMNVPC